MNRRAFLATIAAGLAAAADPERLLWTPGKKLVSIPKPRSAPYGWTRFFNVGDVLTFGKERDLYVVTAVHPKGGGRPGTVDFRLVRPGEISINKLCRPFVDFSCRIAS